MTRILLVLLAALAAAPASASAAEQVLAVEQAAFTADAFAGVVAWSSYDPATKAYRLRILRDGKPADPAVATLPEPFDLDVGPGEDGSPVVVYARDGDLYRYDVAMGAERRVSTASSASWVESQPSIHRGRIAFVRTSPGARLGIVYVGSSTERGKTRRQPTPRRAQAVEGVEQSARGLFVVWRASTGRSCCSDATLYRVKGSQLQHIFRVGSGGANFGRLLSPSVAGFSVYFGRTNTGSGQGQTFFRYELGRRRLTSARGTRLADTLTWRGDRFLMSTSQSGECFARPTDPPASSSCRLVLTDPVSFGPASPADVRNTRR